MAAIFVPNDKGIAELLRSAEVLRDLERRAHNVAAAASDGEAQYNVHAEVGRHRARAAVVTGNVPAMLAEAREHRLAHAIRAASQ